MLSESKKRSEVNNSGIYFLFGDSEQDSELPQVYVGEAENVYKRLTTHIKEKAFWTEVIVFSSKDDNMTKAHIQYLENRLIEIMKRNSNYELVNANDGKHTKLPEYAQADMEEYLNNIKILLPSLGYDVFPKTSRRRAKKDQELSLSVKSVSAKGYLSQNGFVILKGSEISNDPKSTMSSGYRKKRERLISSGGIIEQDGKWVFLSDVEFRSPSEAAVIVTGRATSGRQSWKNSEGKTIKEIEEAIE
jgi:hypothetical protein